MATVLGGYRFTDPAALGQWNPPDAGGIYAIIAPALGGLGLLGMSC